MLIMSENTDKDICFCHHFSAHSLLMIQKSIAVLISICLYIQHDRVTIDHCIAFGNCGQHVDHTTFVSEVIAGDICLEINPIARSLVSEWLFGMRSSMQKCSKQPITFVWLKQSVHSKGLNAYVTMLQWHNVTMLQWYNVTMFHVTIKQSKHSKGLNTQL